MLEGVLNSMCEDEVPRAMVRKHRSLRGKSLELNKLIGQEVILDPETAGTFKVGNEDRVRVRVCLKKEPTVASYLAANFLVPLTESAKKLLAIENHI